MVWDVGQWFIVVVVGGGVLVNSSWSGVWVNSSLWGGGYWSTVHSLSGMVNSW